MLMSSTDTPTQPTENIFMTFLRGLVDKRNAIVLVVDEDEKIIDYRVQPLDEVVATLHVSGFGEPLEE